METSIIKSSINYRCKLKEVLRVLHHLVFLHLSIIINLIRQLSIKINLMNSKNGILSTDTIWFVLRLVCALKFPSQV